MCQNNADEINFEETFHELFSCRETSNPIVYSPEYNISLAGVQSWLPFDVCKSCNIFNYLKDAGLLTEADVATPSQISEQQLLCLHTEEYFKNIKINNIIEGFYETHEATNDSWWSWLPWQLLTTRMLAAMRSQVAGSLLASLLCLKHGWAVNLGGGFTHCLANRAGSYSAYDDVSLCTMFFLNKGLKVIIIDLGKQQCNGPCRRFMHHKDVHICDIFSHNSYPFDGYAIRGVSTKALISEGCTGEEYLQLVRSKLDESFGSFEAGVVLYVAGVDVDVSAQTLIERDQMVFMKALSHKIPIVMMSGGGFNEQSYLLTARSIENLHTFGLISLHNSSVSMSNDGSVEGESESVVSELGNDGVIEFKDVANDDEHLNSNGDFINNS